MAEFKPEAFIQLSCDTRLTEPEIRALVTLANYTRGSIMDAIGSHLNQIQKQGFSTLLDRAREELKPFLHKVDKAREVFHSK